MTISYAPFDAGAGADTTEDTWREMARHWLSTGVLDGEDNELEVYGDSSGMQVKVRTGKAWVRGHWVKSDAEETLAITAADGSNPRKDRVVIRVDFTANTIAFVVLTGTAAVSPALPTLTQNTTRWEFPLATVSVAAGATTIAAGNVSNERSFTAPLAVLGQGYVATDESTTSTSYADLTTAGPDVIFAAPASGSVLLIFGANGYHSAAEGLLLASPDVVVDPTGSATSFLAAGDAQGVSWVAPSTSPSAAQDSERHYVVTGLTAGRTYRARLKYRTASGTANYRRRRLIVLG